VADDIKHTIPFGVIWKETKQKDNPAQEDYEHVRGSGPEAKIHKMWTQGSVMMAIWYD